MGEQNSKINLSLFSFKGKQRASNRLAVRELHWNGFLVKYFTFKSSSKNAVKRQNYLELKQDILKVCRIVLRKFKFWNTDAKTRDSFRLSKQEIRGTEQHRVLSFSWCFLLSCPSVYSSTDEFRLWKRFVWFEAIFLKKNTPKLLECVIFQSRGKASKQHRYLHWWKSIRRFLLVKKIVGLMSWLLWLLWREETIFISMLFGA